MKWVPADNLGHMWLYCSETGTCEGYVYLCGWNNWNVRINPTDSCFHGFPNIADGVRAVEENVNGKQNIR